MALSGPAAPTALFITLEGPDGAGKSSQARALAERLRATGVDALLTREPGGTPVGDRIRELLLRSDAPERTPLADALLFNAARQQLVEEVIHPALTAGRWVICDRFADSTLAYQGYGAGVELETLRGLARIATGGLRPDLTLLFDLPVEVGLARRAGGHSSELTRFELAESFDLVFHQRVRDGFRELATAEPGRWRVVDASGKQEAVTEAAWRVTQEWLSAVRDTA